MDLQEPVQLLVLLRKFFECGQWCVIYSSIYFVCVLEEPLAALDSKTVRSAHIPRTILLQVIFQLLS